MIRAITLADKWVWLTWDYPGDQKFTALKEFKKYERDIMDQGLRGWVVDSNWQYNTMHQILLRLGAFPYACDVDNVYFKKELNQ